MSLVIHTRNKQSGALLDTSLIFADDLVPKIRGGTPILNCISITAGNGWLKKILPAKSNESGGRGANLAVVKKHSKVECVIFLRKVLLLIICYC